VEYEFYLINYPGDMGKEGDVKTMLLSIEKLDKLGWVPEFTSEESIEMTARDVLKDFFE